MDINKQFYLVWASDISNYMLNYMYVQYVHVYNVYMRYTYD